jgi:GNAT superfamily N-acetyltransferase
VDVILGDLSAPAVVAGIEANQVDFFSRFRCWPEAELHDDPETLWSITGIPFPIFNSVLRARIAPHRVSAVVEVAVARGRARNVPILWWVGPTTQPNDLSASLQAHGFVHFADLPGMAVDLSKFNGEGAPVRGLRIDPVVHPESLDTWCDVFAAAFRMPPFAGRAFFSLFSTQGFDSLSPFRHYIGWLEGEPVATATLFLAAGIAGIYNVATLRDARNKGVGAAITSRASSDARAKGYRLGILQSSVMGTDVYRKLGFREYCKIGLYVWVGENENCGEGGHIAAAGTPRL